MATYRKATGDFHYSIGANLTTNYNEVLDLDGQVISAGGSEFATSSTRTEAGHPIGHVLWLQNNGLIPNSGRN